MKIVHEVHKVKW